MMVASKVSSYCSGDHNVPNPRIDPNTSDGGATYLSMVGWHYFRDIYTDEFLRVGRELIDTCSNFKTKSKTLFTPTPFQKAFESNFSNTLEDRHKSRSGIFKETFFKTHN